MKADISPGWLKRRKVTVGCFSVVAFFTGAEYSITFTTLLLYLKTVIQVEKDQLYFSLITAGYFISMTISSLVVARYTSISSRTF